MSSDSFENFLKSKKLSREMYVKSSLQRDPRDDTEFSGER